MRAQADARSCRVVVAIPSFRRPSGLQRLLDALAVLETSAQVSVLVADNDALRHEGADLCVSVAAQYRWPLSALIVAERGIAQTRNALIAHALGGTDADFIAMLDDDEWPEPHWLEALLAMQRATGADVVHGAVLRAFEKSPPAWAARCDGIAPIRGANGRVPMLEGTGNILMARACLEEISAPWFDPNFALGGGEDSEFFTRLRQRGKIFAWADDAVATEYVPASRVTLGWVLRRAYRIGNSDMRVFLKHRRDTGGLLREGTRILAALLLFPVLLVILGAIPNRRIDPVRKLFRAAGKIGALFGRYYDEYSTIHGT
jgi:glycosyltransferase involved in cell wall biosynthesis